MTVFFRKSRKNPNKNAQNLPRTTRPSSWAASWRTPAGENHDTAALPEILTYFEEMCRIPVENVEIQDDLITCITDPFGEEPEWIHFALTRQFPDGEGGSVEILLDIGFPDVKGRLQLEDEPVQRRVGRKRGCF